MGCTTADKRRAICFGGVPQRHEAARAARFGRVRAISQDNVQVQTYEQPRQLVDLPLLLPD